MKLKLHEWIIIIVIKWIFYRKVKIKVVSLWSNNFFIILEILHSHCDIVMSTVDHHIHALCKKHENTHEKHCWGKTSYPCDHFGLLFMHKINLDSENVYKFENTEYYHNFTGYWIIFLYFEGSFVVVVVFFHNWSIIFKL